MGFQAFGSRQGSDRGGQLFQSGFAQLLYRNYFQVIRDREAAALRVRNVAWKANLTWGAGLFRGTLPLRTCLGAPVQGPSTISGTSGPVYHKGG